MEDRNREERSRRTSLTDVNAQMFTVVDTPETTWKTMTVDGMYGDDIQAENAERATGLAEELGYVVLDVVDENTLVVE